MKHFPAVFVAILLVSSACGAGRRHGTTLAAARAPSPADGASAQLAENGNSAGQESLVIEGFVTARVDDVGETTQAIVAKVRNVGGRVVQETGEGADTGWHSFVRVRLPPAGVDDLVEWIGDNADIESKRIEARDVSKELFDQALALENLYKTMVRMQALLERGDLDIDAVLKIEAEMNRVRAEIEKVKGEQRFLKDRVAYATLELTLKRRDGVESGPETKFLPGVRLASMSLLDPAGRTRDRYGVGFVVRSPVARVSYELDVFEAVDDDKRALIATVGGAAYSDHLGGGRRRFLNPYLGMRIGYGRLEGSNFVMSGEAGVELFKSKLAVIDANARATSFFGKGGPDVALVSALELSIAF